jgi:nicotinate-nucleotide adenylyltransferase
MKTARRVALLGGTFDPIHSGHLAAAYAVLEGEWAQEVVFVPAGQPPHKPMGARASTEHRWCMSVLATLDEPRFRVARWEVERSGLTYALDTVRVAKQALEAESPGPIELAWVIGTDAMALIHTWHEVRSLFEATKFLVVARAGFDEVALRVELATHVPWVSPRAVQFVEMPHVDASSTVIRARLAAGEATPELPKSVATYIQRYRLYQGVEGKQK